MAQRDGYVGRVWPDFCVKIQRGPLTEDEDVTECIARVPPTACKLICQSHFSGKGIHSRRPLCRSIHASLEGESISILIPTSKECEAGLSCCYLAGGRILQRRTPVSEAYRDGGAEWERPGERQAVQRQCTGGGCSQLPSAREKRRSKLCFSLDLLLPGHPQLACHNLKYTQSC